MNRIKTLLMTMSYIVSAFMMSILLLLLYHLTKPFLEIPLLKQTLALSEIVVQSREVVTSYWRKYQQCPTNQSLSTINKLASVNKLEVVTYIEQNQCQLTMDVENKKIKLLFTFTKVKDPVGIFICYTNASVKNVPIQCRKLRDIDFFDKEG